MKPAVFGPRPSIFERLANAITRRIPTKLYKSCDLCANEFLGPTTCCSPCLLAVGRRLHDAR